MGASFRNTGEIKELVGCDLLTIGTKFLEEMQNDFSTIEVKLNEKLAMDSPVEKMEMDESIFRFKLNEDAMATEKLAEGIRRFSADMISLEELLKKLITS
jgi:transaldolase